MITDVPTSQELQETADEWLNLAWETVFNLLSQKEEYDEYIKDMQGYATKAEETENLLKKRLKKDGIDYETPPTKPNWDVNTRNQKFWKPEYHKLNLATSLAHQAMELFLKAKCKGSHDCRQFGSYALFRSQDMLEEIITSFGEA